MRARTKTEEPCRGGRTRAQTNLLLLRRTFRAHEANVELGECAVARRALLALGEIDLRDSDVALHRRLAWGSIQDVPLELIQQRCVLQSEQLLHSDSSRSTGTRFSADAGAGTGTNTIL